MLIDILKTYYRRRNSARLGFGTSNAKTCTLSFYVKSSLTGTFCVAVGNGANNRGRPFEYTINSAANTWERKTIEVAGDTSGTYLTDAGRGIILRWCMGIGSNRLLILGSYSAQEVHGTSNQTNLFATNSATFQITGLQFEEGCKLQILNTFHMQKNSHFVNAIIIKWYMIVLEDLG